MSITEVNNAILKEWAERSMERGEGEIANDGLHNKGRFQYSEDGFWSREPSGDEEWMWKASRMRLLFLTKDLNDDEAWDIRYETGRKNGTAYPQVTALFYKNMMRITTGLRIWVLYDKVEDYDGVENYSQSTFFNALATARINCKKQPGGGSISNERLKTYIDAYTDLLTKQIVNLDANVIVCCGGSSMIKDFVAEHCYTDIVKKNDWIYVSSSTGKIVIDSYHLSYHFISEKDFYNQMMKALESSGVTIK